MREQTESSSVLRDALVWIRELAFEYTEREGEIPERDYRDYLDRIYTRAGMALDADRHADQRAIDESALKSLTDQGIPEDVARELLGHARTAGMTMSGAKRVVIDRIGPWEWAISDGDDEFARASDPEMTLRYAADLLYGDSSTILGLKVERDERKPWERDSASDEKKKPCDSST